MKKYMNAFWLTAFLIAGGVDFLFWGKGIGISFPIWTIFTLGSSILLSLRHNIRPARQNIYLGLVIAGLSILPFIRKEPFTIVSGILLTLLALMIWAVTMRNGYWMQYTLWDFIRAIVVLAFASVVNPFRQFAQLNEPTSTAESSHAKWEGWAVLRGILLALPIIGVFSLLLASADLVFAERLQFVLDALRLEKLPETLFRLFYVGVLTFIFCGVLIQALFPEIDVAPTPKEKKIISPFLGWTESTIILGSVNLLFLFFVILQFRYLFGGELNIHETGFTYAEYARRGFGELVWVALISLVLILSLNTVGKRITEIHQRFFTIMSSFLIVLVLVILASALQRLILYEQAYGFTRLRTYTYLFIPWLGLLLLTTLVLLMSNQLRGLAPVLFVYLMVFGLIVGGWNVDRWIAHQNIQRALNGEELDGDYLQTLSADAVPELISQSQRKDLPEPARQEILIGLACRAYQKNQPKPAWQSFNLSDTAASRLLENHAFLWQAYPVKEDSDGAYVLYNGGKRYCRMVNDLD